MIRRIDSPIGKNDQRQRSVDNDSTADRDYRPYRILLESFSSYSCDFHGNYENIYEQGRGLY